MDGPAHTWVTSPLIAFIFVMRVMSAYAIWGCELSMVRACSGGVFYTRSFSQTHTRALEQSVPYFEMQKKVNKLILRDLWGRHAAAWIVEVRF